jgi:hypothetical protein
MSLTITTWNVQNLTPHDAVFDDKVDFLFNTLQALGSDVIDGREEGVCLSNCDFKRPDQGLLAH